MINNVQKITLQKYLEKLRFFVIFSNNTSKYIFSILFSTSSMSAWNVFNVNKWSAKSTTTRLTHG